MHLLPCPECQTAIPVTTSQAGGQVPCPKCGHDVDVPTLGKIRQLPLAPSDGAAAIADQAAPAGASSGGSIGFLVLGLIATASIVIAGFCGIRWLTIDVPLTTPKHIVQYEKAYQELSPANLVREYEQMEKYALEMVPISKYTKIEQTKAAWARNTAVAGGVGLLSGIGAFLMIGRGRKRT